MLCQHSALVALTLLTCTGSCIAADIFRPRGTGAYFSVDKEALLNTPQWNASHGAIPVSATDAIRVASQYHESLSFTGFLELHRWSLHRATLTSAGDDRWYWIVTFRGPFDPTLFKGPGGYSYPGARTIYNHYPVLLTGSMPLPIHETDAAKEARIERITRDLDSATPVFDYNGEWPLPTDGG